MELIWALEHFCFSPRHKIQIWVHCCCIWFGEGLCIVRPSRQNPPRFRTATRWTLDAECWPAPPTGCPGPGSQIMSKMERDSSAPGPFRCSAPLTGCSSQWADLSLNCQNLPASGEMFLRTSKRNAVQTFLFSQVLFVTAAAQLGCRLGQMLSRRHNTFLSFLSPVSGSGWILCGERCLSVEKRLLQRSHHFKLSFCRRH